MGRPRFSIITPIHLDNIKLFQLEVDRCIESIKNQTYDKTKIEYIIINDGSSQEVKIPNYPWIRVIDTENTQRITAYNRGFQEAKGEIYTLLDGDDEDDNSYLEEVDSFYKTYPNYKLFNFGCRYIHLDGGTAEREAFTPKKKKKGHETFGGNNIVNGTFVFHRSVYDDLGGYPSAVVKDIDCSSINYGGVRELYMTSPYDFSAYAQVEFPELRQFFMVDHVNEPNKIIKELGNPFGNDFYLFYKYTRKYHSKPIMGKLLYIVHP